MVPIVTEVDELLADLALPCQAPQFTLRHFDCAPHGAVPLVLVDMEPLAVSQRVASKVLAFWGAVLRVKFLATFFWVGMRSCRYLSKTSWADKMAVINCEWLVVNG